MFRQLVLVVALAGFSLNSVAEVNWTENVKINGDFRFRHDHTEKAASGDKSARDMERFRLRVALQGKVDDGLTVKTRFAGSDGANPLITNVTMTDNASKKPFYIDIAAIEWRPNEEVVIALGKQENPLRVLPASQALYDIDYTPEGLSLQVKRGAVFLTGAGFSLVERGTNAAGYDQPDSWIMAGIAGFSLDNASGDGLTLGAGYHEFTALKGRTSLAPSSLGFGGNSNSASKYIYEYKVAELLAEVRLNSGQLGYRFYLDFLRNLALSKNNFTFLAGAQLKTLDGTGKAAWTFGYAHLSSGTDATVSSLNHSDWVSGIEGGVSHMLSAERRIASNSTGSVTWFSGDVIDPATKKNFTASKLLAEMVFAF